MNETDSIPLYLQMAQRIEGQIESGELLPGARLPSYGQMRKQYGANPVTLERVYGVLEKRGLIRREAKRGVFIAEPKAAARLVLAVVTNPELRHNKYYVHIVSGIQKEAHRLGAEITLCHEGSPIDWKRADGIILTWASPKLRQSVPHNVPCVATMQRDFYRISSVTVDESAGITAAMEHLIALGHRRIGYMTLEKYETKMSTSPRRLQAYRQALLAAGILPDTRRERTLRESGYEPWQEFVDLGRQKMDLWLKDDWEELGCTAILAQNDETAIGIIEALTDAGIRVPEQVSVVGFDGIEAGNCIRPRLTTVSVPLEEIGAAAVATIIEQLRQNGGGGEAGKVRIKPTSIVLSPDFVVRGSTTWAPEAMWESQAARLATSTHGAKGIS